MNPMLKIRRTFRRFTDLMNILFPSPPKGKHLREPLHCPLSPKLRIAQLSGSSMRKNIIHLLNIHRDFIKVVELVEIDRY